MMSYVLEIVLIDFLLPERNNRIAVPVEVAGTRKPGSASSDHIHVACMPLSTCTLKTINAPDDMPL